MYKNDELTKNFILWDEFQDACAKLVTTIQTDVEHSD